MTTEFTKTTDNWFASFQLSTNLLTNCSMTTVGALRANKPQISPERTEVRGRKNGSTVFCFDKEMMIVYFMPQKKRKLVLLSAMYSTTSPPLMTRSPRSSVTTIRRKAQWTLSIRCVVCIDAATKRRGGPYAYFMA